MCCNSWDTGMLMLVNYLLGSSWLRWFPLCCCRRDSGLEIRTAPTCWSWLLLLWPFWPYTTLDYFFPLYGFLWVSEDVAPWIFPLLIPFSTRSPVRIKSVNPAEELPIKWLKKGLIKVPIKISISSLSVNGGCTLPTKSLHFWAYSLKPSLEHMVIFCNCIRVGARSVLYWYCV